MIFISRDVKSLYLSYDTMLALGVINADIPFVGEFSYPKNDTANSVQQTDSFIPVCEAITGDGAKYDCRRWTGVPIRPEELPFKCLPTNNDKMRQWLLDRYGSSTFNICLHQHLPSMSGPPSRDSFGRWGKTNCLS